MHLIHIKQNASASQSNTISIIVLVNYSEFLSEFISKIALSNNKFRKL